MIGVAVDSIMDDPLAGCLPIFEDVANASNMLKSLFMRLRIFYSEPVATALTDQIIIESGEVPFSKWEYIINECQYEKRRAWIEFNPMFETVVLNNWMHQLMKRIQQDEALEFMFKLKKWREERPRK